MVEVALKLKNAIFAKKTKGLSIGVFKNVRIETLNIAMILSIMALTIIYFFMANNLVMTGYQRVVIQKNIESLKMQIQSINIELTQKRSISFLQKAARDLNLVASDALQYIKVSGPVAVDRP